MTGKDWGEKKLTQLSLFTTQKKEIDYHGNEDRRQDNAARPGADAAGGPDAYGRRSRDIAGRRKQGSRNATSNR